MAFWRWFSIDMLIPWRVHQSSKRGRGVWNCFEIEICFFLRGEGDTGAFFYSSLFFFLTQIGFAQRSFVCWPRFLGSKHAVFFCIPQVNKLWVIRRWTLVQFAGRVFGRHVHFAFFWAWLFHTAGQSIVTSAKVTPNGIPSNAFMNYSNLPRYRYRVVLALFIDLVVCETKHIPHAKVSWKSSTWTWLVNQDSWSSNGRPSISLAKWQSKCAI